MLLWAVCISELQCRNLQISWTHALRQIVINCYKYHGREDLLPAFTDDDDKTSGTVGVVRHKADSPPSHSPLHTANTTQVHPLPPLSVVMCLPSFPKLTLSAGNNYKWFIYVNYYSKTVVFLTFTVIQRQTFTTFVFCCAINMPRFIWVNLGKVYCDIQTTWCLIFGYVIKFGFRIAVSPVVIQPDYIHSILFMPRSMMSWCSGWLRMIRQYFKVHNS